MAASIPHSMPPSRITNHDAAYSVNCVDNGQCKQREWYHAIDEGLLFTYTKDYRIYRSGRRKRGICNLFQCPLDKHVAQTSDGASSAGPQSIPRTISRKSQIKRTSDRAVFIDAGEATQGAAYLPYDRYGGLTYGWPPPARHGIGTTFSFADGHAEYKRWTDPHTLQVIKLSKNTGLNVTADIDNCDCDLRWYYKVVWGDIPSGSGYKCSRPLARDCGLISGICPAPCSGHTPK